MAYGFEPHIGLSVVSADPALDSVSLSLPLPCWFSLSFSLSLSSLLFLKINKLKKRYKRGEITEGLEERVGWESDEWVEGPAVIGNGNV